MTIQNVLSTSSITKKYGSFTAVDGMSIDVPAGSVFGVLGPNGSGKTTFLGMILGIIKPTTGSFSWFSGSNTYPKGSVGGILEEPNLMPQMNALNHLKMTAHIKGSDENACMDILKRVGLDHVAKKKAGAFSLGMRQRLAIASALIGNPKVLVLDEPLNGLDPNGIREVRDLIKQLASDGVTVIISSHILDEIEKVCTHLAIFKEGHLVDTQTLNDSDSGDTTRLQIQSEDDNLLGTIRNWPFTNSAEQVEAFLHVEIQSPASASTLNNYLHQQGITLSHLVPLRDGVERIFLEKTK